MILGVGKITIPDVVDWAGSIAQMIMVVGPWVLCVAGFVLAMDVSKVLFRRLAGAVAPPGGAAADADDDEEEGDDMYGEWLDGGDSRVRRVEFEGGEWYEREYLENGEWVPDMEFEEVDRRQEWEDKFTMNHGRTWRARRSGRWRHAGGRM